MNSVFILLLVVYFIWGIIYGITDEGTYAGDLAAVLFFGSASLLGIWAIFMFLVANLC